MKYARRAPFPMGLPAKTVNDLMALFSLSSNAAVYVAFKETWDRACGVAGTEIKTAGDAAAWDAAYSDAWASIARTLRQTGPVCKEHE